MKVSLEDFVLLVMLVGAGGWLYYALAHRHIPCVTPIRYEVVSVDSKLGISKSTFTKDVEYAANAWNDVLGKQVFVEVAQSPDLPVYATYGALQSDIDNQVSGNDIEQGQFVSDKTGQRIYIYGYKNDTDLERGLMHEFGHALGLEHVEDSHAIMYYKSTDDTLTRLSSADIAEMDRACGIKS